MAFARKPVTGMKDILPREMEIRDYCIGLVKQTYKTFGFTPVETPCVEHIENLQSKQGGENEKLIFKILKRGEKLRLEEAKEEADLVDSGLRYDLTLPLARYYANNAGSLPKPFKALQIGPVWRADRPQRGRFRQFYQCDIDILGDPSPLAETELILATTGMLAKLGFSGFTVRINDRRILKAMAAAAGIGAEGQEQAFITLDKLDKIGPDGVKAELLEVGFTQEQVDAFAGLAACGNDLPAMADALGENLDRAAYENLTQIMQAVDGAGDFALVFDPTLVRGMGYYTGTIFEVGVEGFPGSVAGGGRYDGMIGRFTGQETPACGFSIGFERIVTILLEQGFTPPAAGGKKAFLVEKGMDADRLKAVFAEAQAERGAGAVVLVSVMNKNKKFQKEQLAAEGYLDVKEFYVRPL
ncbi:MAG: histidine--tRNA ligase [Lachnospiraceae bacterium]|nr:histidine--tRNA ligase [Lachnospiraceae bacterium]